MYKNYFLALLAAMIVAGTAMPVFASDNGTGVGSEDSQTEPTTPPVDPEQPTEPEKPEKPQPEKPVTPPVEPETPDIDETVTPDVPKDNAAVGGGSQNNGLSQSSVGTVTVGTGTKGEILVDFAETNQSKTSDSSATTTNNASNSVQPQVTTSVSQNEELAPEEDGEEKPDTSNDPEIAVPLTGELSAIASRTNQVAVTVLLVIGAIALSAGVAVMMADKLKKD